MERIINSKGFSIVSTEEGGFATVYKVQNKDGQVRAFKSPKISNNTSEERKRKIKEDFQNECKTLESLVKGKNPSPNIIKVYNSEIIHEPYYLEMDFIEGMPFDQYAETHFMKIEEVFHFIENIAGALAYCHHYIDESGKEQSIVHNDLHSANIRYCNTNKDFILFDFGLSMERGGRVRTSWRNNGWCEFMPPERCSMECYSDSPYKDTPATPAWDIYSLGCLVFLSLTGQAPFSIRDFTDVEISQHHMKVDTYRPWEHIVKLRQKHFNKIYPEENYKEDCPTWLIDMIEKCMARESKDRYENAQIFLNIFRGYRKRQTVPYDDYIKLTKEAKKLEKDRNKLQEDYKMQERAYIKLRERLKQILSLNWMVAVVVVIAFICNCLPYWGGDIKENGSIGPTAIATSIIASIIIIAVTIYNFIASNSDKD